MIGGQGTKPSISVSWYAKAMDHAMVLDDPTIFGSTGNKFLGAGEAGREVVAGESHLLDLIGQSVDSALGGYLESIENILLQYLPEAARTQIYLDKDVLVGELSSGINKNMRATQLRQARGLV